MYETAPVGGNKFEAACALRNLKKIMGQIASNPQQQQSTGHRAAATVKNGKVHHRYSSPPIAMRSFANEENDEVMILAKAGGGRESKRISTAGKVAVKAQLQRQLESGGGDSDDFIRNQTVSSSGVRPVTVMDMNNFNRSLGNGSATAKSGNNKPEVKTEKNNSSALIIMGQGGGDDKGKGSAAAQCKSRELFAVEGYHKTDHCYYKRPDGGYLKLPPDSYHKMSEGCYVKRTDGTFVRIDSASTIGQSQNSNKSGVPIDATTAAEIRPKSNVLRFLKRSKSHTPSTMKELQREKDRMEKIQNRIDRNAAQQLANATGQPPATNRRVMVTMIDGGLPVVATSKADRVPKVAKAHLQVKSGKGKDLRNKVNRKWRGVIFLKIDN